MLEFRNVNHYFGNNNVIKDFSLKIIDRKVTSILGPSGCGKTTLLRLASGLVNIQNGKIIYGEHILTNNTFRPGKPLYRLQQLFPSLHFLLIVS